MESKEQLVSAVGVLSTRCPLLIKEIEKCSLKWAKRTVDCLQWPEAGTFDLEKIVGMEVLIRAYKSGQKTKKRSEKRDRELEVLKLFHNHGKRLNESTKKHVAQMIAKRGTEPTTDPPPYAKQLPVRTLRVTGDYALGLATSATSLYPRTSQSEKEGGSDGDEVESLGETGKADRRRSGYVPSIKQTLKQAELEGQGVFDSPLGGEEFLEEQVYSPLPRKGKRGRGGRAKSKSAGAPHSMRTRQQTKGEDHPEQGKAWVEVLMEGEEEYGLGEEGGEVRGASPPLKGGEEEPSTSKMVPLLAKGQNLQYIPWPSLDLEGLIGRLPFLCDGANRWIAVFEEETMAVILAIGDMKALLAKSLSKHEMIEIFRDTGLVGYAETQANDGDMFNRYRNVMWAVLRERFPPRLQPDAILPVPLKDSESPQVYVQMTKREWIRQTGARPERDMFHQLALRKRIVEGLPTSAQSRLNDAVGLYNMPFEQFTDNVVDAVLKVRAQESRQKQQDEEAVRKLTQQQLTAAKKKMAVVKVSEPVSQPQPVVYEANSWRRGPPAGRGRSRGRGRGNQGRWGEPPRCYNCGRLGHISYSCRLPYREPSPVQQAPTPYSNTQPEGPVNPWRGSPAGY